MSEERACGPDIDLGSLILLLVLLPRTIEKLGVIHPLASSTCPVLPPHQPATGPGNCCARVCDTVLCISVRLSCRKEACKSSGWWPCPRSDNPSVLGEGKEPLGKREERQGKRKRREKRIGKKNPVGARARRRRPTEPLEDSGRGPRHSLSFLVYMYCLAGGSVFSPLAITASICTTWCCIASLLLEDSSKMSKAEGKSPAGVDLSTPPL